MNPEIKYPTTKSIIIAAGVFKFCLLSLIPLIKNKTNVLTTITKLFIKFTGSIKGREIAKNVMGITSAIMKTSYRIISVNSRRAAPPVKERPPRGSIANNLSL
jgi:hypothetical protein